MAATSAPHLPRGKWRIEYRAQRDQARKRGISFFLTYEEWYDLWMSSGRYSRRGCHRGQYCMARRGDKGAYEIGNVDIVSVEANLAVNQNRKGIKHSAAIRAQISASLTGQTRPGVSAANSGRVWDEAARQCLRDGIRKSKLAKASQKETGHAFSDEIARKR